MKFRVDRCLNTGLFTGRYQSTGVITSSGCGPVRITVGHPRFRLGYDLIGRAECLYPSRSMLTIADETEFDRTYRSHLDVVGVDRIHTDLTQISEAHGGIGLVLLCFEDVFTFGERSCHRRSFARWWEEQTGQPVPELTRESMEATR
jgi:hypothetical protein